ncbi:MAG: glycosyl hydrolase family 18 protein [Deltaproteobacteria bacterium]|nr:glycosyl hydrolase family 18 protein [Deltaproteobacteria bacterium]
MQNTTPNNLVNAWIFLNEDEPAGTNYNSSDSCYQTLIQNNIYQSIDILYMCFVETVPTSSTTIPSGDGSSYTIQMGNLPHNQEYMDKILVDAKNNNSNMKFGVTVGYDSGQVSNIFSNPEYTPQQNAENFAANLLKYMQHYGLSGFDIDWEWPMCNEVTQTQFKLLFTAVGQLFQKQSEQYYCSISPASNANTDTDTINSYLDFVNLQMYFSTGLPLQFPHVKQQLFGYGVKFEASGPTSDIWHVGFQTALNGYELNISNNHFNSYINWRLNSQNFMFEQTQQQALYGLIHNNYLVENQWGGSSAPWHPGGTWVMGCRNGQHVVQLEASSADGGQTLKGTMTYDGEGPIGFTATLRGNNSYQVQNQWGGSSAPWHPGGTWLIGGRSNQNVVAIDISSSDAGKTLKGTMTYANEGPIGFAAALQDHADKKIAHAGRAGQSGEA